MFLGNIIIFVSLATILVAQSKGEKKKYILLEFSKGQLNSEWIYEVINSPKSQPKIKEISALPSNKLPGQKSLILCWHFVRNYDFIDSFWT